MFGQMGQGQVKMVILFLMGAFILIFQGREFLLSVSTLEEAIPEAAWPNTCVDGVKSVEEPYTPDYQLRDQVIDLEGVRYAAYQWDGQITRKDFDECIHTHTPRIQFKILDSKLYVKASNLEWKHSYAENRYIKIIEPLLMAIHMYRIPDMDFWVDLSDTLECNHPVFTYSLNTECEQGGFTVPSYGAYGVSRGRKQLDYVYECLDAHHPYDARIPKGVWRGSTTGSVLTKDNYMENRRVRLSLLARNRTDIMDVGLYTYVQADAEAVEKLKEVVPIVPSIPMEHYNNYTMILDLDGNGWSDRFTKLVTYNTPMFKQISIFQEYFAHLMQPGVHIEMFDESLVDLVPRLEELLKEYRSSPRRLREMANAMHEFAKEHGGHLGLIRAVAYGLNVYASKLTWKTELESGFVEVEKSKCCEKNPTFPAQFIHDVSTS
ncbi:hypothetical protein BSKO_05022 [Bryopsis sp. KO-2023]|nr:hypothetical protein BSKO_05022 [Bryopsis sp. KO-2023]